MEDQNDLLKELKLQNKKLERENRRLQTECDVLKIMNEKVSKTQQFFERDNQRQLCYNRQLLKTSPYIVVMVNEELKTVMASDVFFQMTEHSRDAVREGMSLSDALSGILEKDELEIFLDRCEYVLNEQGSDSYLLTSRLDGKETCYQADICYYLAQNEDAKGLSIILSDMTEIVEAKKRAENADRAKSSFLASMSHEIRTPLNTVLGMNEMILREAKDNEILEYSSNIQSAGRTLLYLINSILDFSKIEEGKMEILPVEYDTASVLNNLVVSVSERARQKDLSLIVDFDPNIPAAMVGDDVRLTQVILNLLTNAVKYTEKGSVTFSVKVKETAGKKITLLVSIKDTGIGIRKEDIPKLYEIFERLDEVRNRNIEGTGLGISIVTRLLKMMGSNLNVESVYGQGSEFSFEIVQKVADATPIGDYSMRLDAARTPVGNETLIAPDSRILVVDDNEMNLKVAKNLFRLFDIKPDLVESGSEALERLRSGNKYHIIFLDHMMPKMDGIETLNHMKEENLVTEDTPVIALTANAVNGAKKQYLALGFDGYLSKPIDVSKLEEMLEKFLPEELVSHKQAERIKADSDSVQTLADAGFDTEAALRYTAGDRSFYLELVALFADRCKGNMSLIRADYEKKDWADYEIKTHSLKSTARQIGANEVADLALEQELAAKDKKLDVIDAGVENLLAKYEKLCDQIHQILKKDQPESSSDASDEAGASGQGKALSHEEFSAMLADAKEKIFNFEVESAQAIIKKLVELPEESLSSAIPSDVSNAEITELLDGILRALEDFDSMTAEDKLQTLMESVG